MKTSDLYLYRLNKAAHKRTQEEYANRNKGFFRKPKERPYVPDLTDRWRSR
jgi:hypothetical protein